MRTAAFVEVAEVDGELVKLKPPLKYAYYQQD
jgi:hypothetical protein